MKKVWKLLTLFRKILDESRHKPNKHWLMKAADFITNHLNHDYKTVIWKCTQHVMKGNLMLSKDLLET